MPAKKPFEVATINVNGVRAAFRNGMGDWLKKSTADVLALQEVRASRADLDELFDQHGGLAANGGKWHILHDEASAKGRAGVALVSKVPALESRTTLGPKDFDSAGIQSFSLDPSTASWFALNRQKEFNEKAVKERHGIYMDEFIRKHFPHLHGKFGSFNTITLPYHVPERSVSTEQ